MPALSVPPGLLGPQEIGAELVEARAADLTHHEVDLGLEDVDRLFDPRQSERDRAIKRRTAKGDELCAETQRDQYIGAAPDAAVEHHRHSIADRRLDRRQGVKRGRRLIELPPAMV